MAKSTTNSAGVKLGDITTYQAGVMQATAHRNLKHTVSEFLRPYNLTMMEWFALGHICDHKDTGVRVTTMAKILQTTLPYTTTLINQLEAKGWISRQDHANDSRVTLLFLVEGKCEVCKDIERDLRTRLRDHIYSRIARDDFQSYINVLFALSR